jgi:hypothetical protein
MLDIIQGLYKGTDMFNKQDGIGIHTILKTFEYQYYKKLKGIATIQCMLNHSYSRIT